MRGPDSASCRCRICVSVSISSLCSCSFRRVTVRDSSARLNSTEPSCCSTRARAMLTSPAWFSSWLSSSASTRAISARSGCTVRLAARAARPPRPSGDRRRPVARAACRIGRREGARSGISRLQVSGSSTGSRLGRRCRLQAQPAAGAWPWRLRQPRAPRSMERRHPHSARTCATSARACADGRAAAPAGRACGSAHPATAAGPRALRRWAARCPASMPMISDSSSWARSPMADDARHARATLRVCAADA